MLSTKIFFVFFISTKVFFTLIKYTKHLKNICFWFKCCLQVISWKIRISGHRFHWFCYHLAIFYWFCYYPSSRFFFLILWSWTNSTLCFHAIKQNNSIWSETTTRTPRTKKNHLRQSNSVHSAQLAFIFLSIFKSFVQMKSAGLVCMQMWSLMRKPLAQLTCSAFVKLLLCLMRFFWGLNTHTHTIFGFGYCYAFIIER